MAATRTIPHFVFLPSEVVASPFWPLSLNCSEEPTTNCVGFSELPSFVRHTYSLVDVSMTRSYCWCFCFLLVVPTVCRSLRVAVWTRLSPIAAVESKATAKQRPDVLRNLMAPPKSGSCKFGAEGQQQ